MQIKRSSLAGCCVSSHFYDLGAAHGKYSAKSFEEFVEAFIRIGYSEVNTATTNSRQIKERKYLEQLGFTVSSKSTRGVWIHTAISKDIEAKIAPIKAKLMEAALKKAEEEKKKQQERMLLEQERRKKLLEENAKNPPIIKGYEGATNVRVNTLYALRHRFPNHPIRTIVRQAFNIDLPEHFEPPKGYGLYHYYNKSYARQHITYASRIAKAINYRLKKRAEGK